MDAIASSAISSIIILTMSILLGATISNEILQGTDTDIETDLDEIQDMVNDTVQEISTYFNIKQIFGKYYYAAESYKIQKIVILLKPFFDIEIDLSELKIILLNEQSSKILKYNLISTDVDIYDVFEHPHWQTLQDSYFTALTMLDKDGSIEKYNIINSNSDMIYIAIRLPSSHYISKGERIKIMLLPSSGVIQTLAIEGPLPIDKIVKLR
jgi:archaellin